MQQDAVKHAAEAIGLSYSLPASLMAIREVRNSAIGTPYKRGSSRTESIRIVRFSITQGFTLYAFDITDRRLPTSATAELIAAQREAVVDASGR